ncbi:putative U-box domain-containing protein 50 isoform X1 [Silene latifolia]|uniref:putative U-box domain-containing protein 50 isoform X1 n=2 Tax=Silene latifolia TaxID=37657 RepID=UPI003D77E76E
MSNIERIGVHEKIYVALGNEMQEEEALLTLNWVLKKWASSSQSHHPISIIILFITTSSSNHFVYTPFGKLPASSVSDDKLQILRKCEREKIDQLLSKYIAFCGKVKTEVQEIDKQDEPIQSIVVDLMNKYRITKLVMGMIFMRSPSGRSKSAISRSFYVQRNKPEYCELYILCSGKLVVIKDENEEGHIEDEQGVVMGKLKQKGSLKDWLGKMLHHSSSHGKSQICPSSRASTTTVDSDSPVSRNVNQWETYEHEIEEYLKELLGSNSRKGKENVENDESSVNNPSEQNILDCVEDVSVKIEALKKEIQAAQRMTEVHKNGTKAEIDRQAKALWAICLCNYRIEELEAHITEEITARDDITKEIDNTKEQLYEILTDVQESKNSLTSLLDLQSELSSKLQVSSLAKLGAEAQLEHSATARTELVREIEELRRQRDVFHRRIEFCKEKDAIEMATKVGSDPVSCRFREFSVEEVRLATDNFAKYRRLTCGRDWRGAYKGRINRLSVSIKVIDPDVDLSQGMFQAKVSLLANTRHPHIISFIGFCTELRCLVFEYMHNGCLRDILFSRPKSKLLQWHQRIQIAAQVSTGLGFLHLAQPRPIVYGGLTGLNPSRIFLDRNLAVKIHPFELVPCSNGDYIQADVSSFGDLLLQLLTGRNWAMLDCEATVIDKQAILEALDDNAGDWPSSLAEEIVELAVKCRSVKLDPDVDLTMSSVTKELKKLKKKADDIINRREYHMGVEDGMCFGEESTNVPSIFICPIFKVVMDNPHIAADGHSYELEAIEEWLRMGHTTSPVTNQKFNHKHLIPNNNLRFLIEDWRSSTS